ncbi:MAG: hypothetical protein GX975_01675 [Clostridiales bacterium]|nr:hypothetical protein [Clostridiales bacterium]
MFITRFTQNLEKRVQNYAWLYRIMLAYYRPLVKCEINLAEIRKSDRVLCVGGGSCPMTAILLHEYTGAHVTVLDCNPYCVKGAKKFLKKKGLEEIDVVCCNGADACCRNYSVVHLAMQVSPLEETLINLMRSGRKNTRFLVRTPKKLLAKFYEAKIDYGKAVSYAKHNLFTNAGRTLMFTNSR